MAEAPTRPRTWFPVDDDDDENWWVGPALILAGILIAPWTLLLSIVLYRLTLWQRLRWYWPLWFAVPLTGWVLLVQGLHQAVARYLAVYPEALAVLTGAGALDARALLLGDLPHWLVIQLPLGGAVGALLATGRAGWAELRRPSWQPRSTRRGPLVLLRLLVVTWLLVSLRIPNRDGVTLGTDDRGRLIRLGRDETKGNVLITGALDSGKTTTALEVLQAGVVDACPTVVIDLKNAPEVTEALAAAAARAGRRFYHFSFHPSAHGNAYYDPLTRGDPSRRKDLLIGAGIWTEEHYRQIAERYLQFVFQVIDATAATRPAGRAMLDEAISLLDPSELVQRAMAHGNEELAHAAQGWNRRLLADERSAIGGLQHRLINLADSTAGRWIRSGPAEATIDLAKAMEERAVVVFSLDGQGYPKVAAPLGALIIQDLQTLAGELIAARNRRVAYVFVDEFATLDSTNILGLLNKARQAELHTIIATQSIADLAKQHEVFLRQVLELTNVKLIHRVNERAAADLLSAQAGNRPGYEERLNVELRTGVLGQGVGAATGDGQVRKVPVPRFDPDVLMEQRSGRCAMIVKAPTVRYELVVRVVRRRLHHPLSPHRGRSGDLQARPALPVPALAAAAHPLTEGHPGDDAVSWSLAPAGWEADLEPAGQLLAPRQVILPPAPAEEPPPAAPPDPNQRTFDETEWTDSPPDEEDP
jgi:TraM recognition site of TraD and TraG